MVGNEADIIETFVRYHVPLLDALVLIVHRPIDGTGDILRKLREEGLPLDVRPARHAAFRQAEETSEVARELLRGGAEHVVLLDADEFLRLPDDAYLRRALPALPADRFGAWRWQGYVPLPGDDATEANPIRRIRHRRREEGVDCFKVVLTPAFLREEYSLLEGNHCVMQARPGRPDAAAPMMELKALRLAHFPVRSREQLETKVILGELGKRASGGGDGSLGFHWGQLYGAIRDRGSLDAEALRRVAERYPFTEDEKLDLVDDGLVEDPVTIDFDLRYPPPTGRDTLQNVLRWLDADPRAVIRPRAPPP
jgi:hypothetical protein